MATLALAAVGSAIGGALLPAGFSLFGATLTGAMVGQQIGALAGSFVDQALFGGSGQLRRSEGPRLSDLHVTASNEGAPIPRLYGRARLGGQVIWAAPLIEEIVSSRVGGGKGGLAGGSTSRVEYRYYASFAVAIAEGEITRISRIWSDGRELNLSTIMHRVYTGSEAQAPDALIEATEGAGHAPAFRGTAYIVFERLDLAPFGNRIPQLSFEVHRSVDPFERAIRGVVLIPGSGEFVYSDVPVHRNVGFGELLPENVHTNSGETDWAVSLDQLQATLPNARSVSLVVSWFGTDLRAGHCQLEPRVDSADKLTSPLPWQVAGLDRATASVVSSHDGQPAYGGTPSDQTVVSAIRDLNARGLSVVFSPFILMDVPVGNVLPDPYGNPVRQPAYPWRGRITCHPAPGQPGSPDKTASAAAQLAALVGTAAPAHFALSGDAVVYTGPDEWSLRRMVLHNAYLCKAAGGVDAFVLGSELPGLSRVRSGAATYPFVAALAALAGDVRAVLGAETKILYAADWSEYFGHQPADGSGDVYFHLDPLWSSSHIDAIGIDCYWPLADWRDGRDHLDHAAGARSPYDLDYLKANISAGEGFDWHYATVADREAQVRTPITDGSGKPWVFRFKDLKSWWQNPHFNRPGGIESAAATAWVAQSKPVWLMEIGCPAVDKGANQPNVFVDPKSSESYLPYFSLGTRDDLAQRRYLQALVEAFDPTSAEYVPGANPVSTVYGGRMLDVARVHVYAWDARPFPAFPYDLETWRDGDNWRLGHWINGRIASAPLANLVHRLLLDYDFPTHDASRLNGIVPGFVIDRIMSARDALQPLELAYFFDSIESIGSIKFRHRGSDPTRAALAPTDLVDENAEQPLAQLTRAQETDLPNVAKISYVMAEGEYRQAVAEARRLAGQSGRVSTASLPIVLDPEQAGAIAETWLFESWNARERASLILPPSQLALEPGDDITLLAGGRERLLRITEIGDHGARSIDARAIDPDGYRPLGTPSRVSQWTPPAPEAPGELIFLDLPSFGDEASTVGIYAAAYRKPWPGPVALYRSPDGAGHVLQTIINAPALTGVTRDVLTVGPEGRYDAATSVRVRLDHGELSSVSQAQLLAGANLAAIEHSSLGLWEVIQFQSAALVAPSTYRLTTLLRGLGGTEDAMVSPIPEGARFILLDPAITAVPAGQNDIGLPFVWRHGPAARNIGSPSYVDVTHEIGGRALRPLSPVHVRATRDAAGNIALSWARRTRVGGDSWASSDVPLGEATERYELEVLAGAAVKRVLTSAVPAVTYTAGQQVADFGSVQAAISVAVYQIGAVGRGIARRAVI